MKVHCRYLSVSPQLTFVLVALHSPAIGCFEQLSRKGPCRCNKFKSGTVSNTANRASHYQVAQRSWHVTRVSVTLSDNFSVTTRFLDNLQVNCLFVCFFARISWFSIHKPKVWKSILLSSEENNKYNNDDLKHHGKVYHLTNTPALQRRSTLEVSLSVLLICCKSSLGSKSVVDFLSTLKSVVPAIW